MNYRYLNLKELPQLTTQYRKLVMSSLRMKLWKDRTIDNDNIVNESLKLYKQYCTMTFDDLCIDRAKQLIKYANSINKRVLIMWSGGIDSTVVLSSFLQLGHNPVVALNHHSVYENHVFYDKFIQGKLSLVSLASVKFTSEWRDNYIVVDGDPDMFGSIGLDRLIYQGTHNLRDTVTMSTNDYNYSVIDKFWDLNPERNIMSEEDKHQFIGEVITAATRVDFKINTLWNFWWFVYFNFKATDVYWIHINNLIDLPPEDIRIVNEQYYNHFFGTIEFQNWALQHNDYNMPTTVTDYKKVAKKFILNFDGNQMYYDNKTKIGSVNSFRDIAELLNKKVFGLTYDYQIHDALSFINSSDVGNDI